MCFSSKPKKIKPPAAPKLPPVQQPPVQQPAPTVETGVTRANEERRKKRGSDGLSLFQIALMPGAAFSGEDAGIGASGEA